MQRRARRAVFFLIETFEKFGHLGDGNTDRRAKRTKCVVAGFGHQCLMRDVERHDHEINATFEYDISGLWIDVDVEFCRWRDVADFEIGPPHENNLPNAPGNIRRFLQGSGNVGQRSERTKRHAACRFAAQRVDDPVDRVAVLQGHCRVRQVRAVKTGFSMHMFGGDEITAKRSVAPGIDRNINFSR